MDLTGLSDEALIAKVDCLARTERFTLTDFLLHLGELDKRHACEKRGYPSVFAYLTRRLGFAESDAVRRVRAARAIRQFPSILGMIARGELHLVGLSLLQPHLTSANHRGVLCQARGRSQREIEKLAARLAPAMPEPRDTIRALPPAEKNAAPPQTPEISSPLLLAPEPLSPAQAASPEPPEVRHLFSFAAGESVQRLFMQARDLLRHKYPQGRMEDIIGEALKLLVGSELPSPSLRKREAKRGANARGRHIPQLVKDRVWARDRGRCSFVSDDGTRCAETGWLEYDHKKPWAQGGRSDDTSNIRLLCRAHNQSEARRTFPHMDKTLDPG